MTDEEKKELQRAKNREYQRRYRAEHADELAEKRKAYMDRKRDLIQQTQLKYRQTHTEQLKEYWKQYREQHADAIRQYREENRDALRERQRTFRQEHGDKLRAKQKERRETGKAKTIKVVYYGETNPEVLRLRHYLMQNVETTSTYIKRLIAEDLKQKGYYDG